VQPEVCIGRIFCFVVSEGASILISDTERTDRDAHRLCGLVASTRYKGVEHLRGLKAVLSVSLNPVVEEVEQTCR
jgi:hypothetical protein